MTGRAVFQVSQTPGKRKNEVLDTALLKPLSVSTIVEALHHRADTMPNALAYAMGHEEISYGRLRDDVLQIASALAVCGLEPGGRCAVLLPTGLDFIRTLFAVQALGAAPVPINPAQPIDFLLGRLRLLRCSLVIAGRSALTALQASDVWPPGLLSVAAEDLNQRPADRPQQRPLPKPDDPAVLVLTSGTSGEPHAAVILHRNLMASVRSGLTRLEVRADDVLVNWVPLYHGLGLVRFVFGPLFFGCPVHLVQPSIANLRNWLETASRVRATITGGPDFAYRAATELVEPAGLDLRALRYAISSGEPIRLDTIQRFERKFGLSDVVRPVYGLAEANGVTSFAPVEPLRTDEAGNVSCGRAVDGLEVEIVDADGKLQPVGVPGEIRVRGEQVFAGYLDDQEATRQKLRDGWLYTGDIGSLDADGHLYVTGRVRAMIKRGGALLAPRDIEQAAERVAGVLGSAAIGIIRPSLFGTEDVVVVAEVDPAVASSDAVQSQTTRSIGDEVSRSLGFTPAEVVLVRFKSIPRTPNGKVRHEELRRLYSTGELVRSGSVLFGGGRDRLILS